ncbi:murein hydrolase activator EnvC family protein [Mucilaginibacter boryungensis]|uniref:Peptidoglycan DD-metalloendopeptidase family protein n=1 Tax=Mucilaginibacter boryungensis TaxID=768480 RepID=A0ABR9XBQ2_9SPHI|nr:M23 family metallopeptidase [Mucilaginibacter boryungensis]MBE9664776.1 peptidoglycan DD-metalloendopeptidase family protein [Mucilaginibacter boryungensis]
MKFYKITFFIICFFAAAVAFGQSSAELKRRRDKLNEELNQLNHDLEEATNNKKANLKQLNLIKAQISLRTDKINTINSEMHLLDNQIQESNKTVHSLQGQLDQLKKEYAAMVLFAYHNKSSYNQLMFVFSSDNFNQAYKRMKYLQEFSTYRERQAAAIRGKQTELHVKIDELDKTKKNKNDLLKDQEKEKENLGKAKKDEDQVISGLSKQQGQLKQQQREKINKINEINRMYAAAIRREIEEARRRAEEEARRREAAEAAKAKAEGRAVEPSTVKKITKNSTVSEVLNATPEAAKLSNDFLGNKGRLPWPVANGGITQGFGMYSIGGIKNDNKGVDIRTNEGASVRAVFNGTVIKVENVGGSYVVLINHGEYYTMYGNLRSVSVSRGQKVTTKQNIGVVETDNMTGMAIANFQLWKGVDAVNPVYWLAPN